MRTRLNGLVQLKTEDAVQGVISRMGFIWKYVRVDGATVIAFRDPNHPAPVDGVVWIPKRNVAYIQELIRAEVAE